MSVGFIITGALGLMILVSVALSIQFQSGVNNLQPSMRSILFFWKEKDREKRTNAFFYFLYLILVGIVCSLINFDFFDLDLIGLVLGLAVYAVPIFIFSKIAGFQKKQ